ncbi:MAG: polyprenyl synthetase family protein [Eubacteriales bacterium]|nr:polyprenyl synthetase family protein [Eubacteriales bacterium]MDD3882231.1 polyprenyl synthetase family protein [Eubacteriales bacterium]MDD4512580.1 polyprenyl synthetase family protein [Eubacteriales bacterium]
MIYEKQYDEYLALVDDYIEKLWDDAEELPKTDAPPLTLAKAMRYSLLAGGKRMRPVLLMAAADFMSVPLMAALPYAAAVEMIHTYSLIHDDLPAMDDDDLRRGKPSNHIVFGDGMAILAGDGLQSAAFETMLSAAANGEIKPENAIRAMKEISLRAGIGGMIGGQVIDLESEDRQPEAGRLFYLQQKKTADLITAPILAGLLLGGASGAILSDFEKYGAGLGHAFQVIDDCLDVIGNQQELGKPIGSDAEHGKLTAVSLYGLSGAKKAAEEFTQDAVNALAPYGEKADFFTELANYSLSRMR